MLDAATTYKVRITSLDGAGIGNTSGIQHWFLACSECGSVAQFLVDYSYLEGVDMCMRMLIYCDFFQAEGVC